VLQAYFLLKKLMDLFCVGLFISKNSWDLSKLGVEVQKDSEREEWKQGWKDWVKEENEGYLMLFVWLSQSCY
jgi:hypothetical protein